MEKISHEKHNNRIIFSSNVDINLHKKTQVNDTIIYEIFMDRCVKYISTSVSHEYIGIMYPDDTLHIFNLVNDGVFSDALKDNFEKIDEEQILSMSINNTDLVKDAYSKRRYLINFFKEIPGFLYIHIRDLLCVRLQNLDAVKEIIKSLNIELIKKCPGFRINIDYILNFENHSSITLYNNVAKPYKLLLCLFYGNNCVSSLTIGFYENDEIHINSETNLQYKERKFNKLLRSVIIIIGKSLDSNFVVSESINPISAWLMVNSFNAISKNELGETVIDKTTSFDKIKPIIDSTVVMSVVVLNDENIANAQQKFHEIISQINCEPLSNTKGGGKSRKSRKSRKGRKGNRKIKSRKNKKSSLNINR
jgi:hypothetical protein